MGRHVLLAPAMPAEREHLIEIVADALGGAAARRYEARERGLTVDAAACADVALVRAVEALAETLEYLEWERDGE